MSDGHATVASLVSFFFSASWTFHGHTWYIRCILLLSQTNCNWFKDK